MALPLALIVIIVVILLATNRMSFDFSGKDDTRVARVCDLSVIEAYNALSSKPTETSADLDALVANIADFADDVSSKNNHESDPTCLAILYQAAISQGNREAAAPYVSQIEKLANDGIFVDNRLTGLTSIGVMKSRVEASGSDDGALGSG